MTSNQIAIASLTICNILLAVVAVKNSRTARQSQDIFQHGGELRAARWASVTLTVGALISSILGALFALNPRTRDSWVLAMIGLCVMLLACFSTLFRIRLEPDSIRFGFLCRRQVAYSEIVELVRASTGRDVVYYLVLRSGRCVTLGSDLACEKLLGEELQRRTGCKIPRNAPGQPVPRDV